MATPVWLSTTNGFLPAETGQAIAFIRDKSRFQMLNYVQLVNCPKPLVRYAYLDPDEAVRVPTSQEFRWNWNQPRPVSQGNVGNFKWIEVEVERYSFGYTIGETVLDTVEGWNPKVVYDEGVLSKAMTNCTNNFVDMMEDTATWGSSNYGTATSLNGGAGYWSSASSDENSSSFLAIKKTLDAARNRIVLGTNGAVSPSDMKLILSPDAAIALSNTSEIHSYMSRSQWAYPIIQGSLQGKSMDTWSLPQKLYGMEVIVEDAPIATNRAAAAGTTSTLLTEKLYAKDKTSAVICSRPGALDGRYGSSNFSTFQKYFWKYEMKISTFHDPQNEVYKTYVDDCYKAVCPAPQSGFLITGIMPA